ncbi:MAG: type II toxin-antitoxin system HicB family antitoxin [Calditrichaeota bacterium]|nr:type II toxin-antitoxin system HicB family antitoxin [Calditrichota bacterium]
MLSDYIQAALNHSSYELMKNGRFFASVEGLKGLWADGDTLEECRRNLIDTLEDWLFISLSEKIPIPTIDNIELIPNQSLEVVDA